TSNAFGDRVVTAFNMHPSGVDTRTNLYYVVTRAMGRTWTTVDGRKLELPLEDKHCPALVHDYEADGRLVYVKDIQLDADGNPVVLIVTSALHQPGPGGEPRFFTTVVWDGEQWQFRNVTGTSHNYDMGSLYIEDGDVWR